MSSFSNLTQMAGSGEPPSTRIRDAISIKTYNIWITNERRVDDDLWEGRVIHLLERQDMDPTAWYFNPEGDNLSLEHKYEPNQPVTAGHLHILGVNLWSGVPTDDHLNNRFLNGRKYIDEYTNEEVVTFKEGIMEDFQKNVEKFATEHLHTEKEARFIIEGSGYEDIRDIDERYIRIFVKPGDLIILPAGIYHRFVLDEGKYIKAALWYQKNASRVQFDRNPNVTDTMECREDYLLEVRAAKQVFIDF